MNAKLLVLLVVLVDFVGLSAWAVYQHGYLGVFAWAFHNSATMQGTADLLIALGLVLLWMRADAAARGVRVLPWVVATLLLGSIGPLLYLIRREMAAGALAQSPSPAAAR